MSKTIRKFLIAFVLLLLFAVFTFAVKTVDVRAIGPEGSSVGLASLNSFFFRHLGTNSMWYGLTKLLGYFAILFAGCFAIAGILQLCKRRSLAKVDRPLLLLAVFYVIVGVCYILFEKTVINYRPVILDPAEGLEASYPSSHTLLVICITGSAMICLRAIHNDRPINVLAYVLGIVMAGITVVGRLFAGVHWFTDILGSVILSAALLEAYDGAVCAAMNPRKPSAKKGKRKSKRR